MRRLGKGILLVARLALTLVALALLIVFSALVVVRTDWGRARVLKVALAQLSNVLSGKASVGRLEGDLAAGTMILYDVEIDDAEGQPAIRADRVEAHYNVVALLLGDLHVDSVRVAGAWLRLANLADGRFNVAALGVAKPESENKEIVKPADAKPVEFTIRNIVVDGRVRYEVPTDRPELRLLEAGLHVEGRLGIGAAVVITVHRVDVNLVTPSAAAVTASGVVDIHGGHVWLREVEVGVGFEGAALHALIPEAKTRGHFHLHLDASGQTNALAVALLLNTSHGHIVVDGRLGIPGDAFTWQASVSGDDLDPAASWSGIPHGLVWLAASGSGQGGVGEVQLSKLIAIADGAHVRASGKSDFLGFGELKAEVEVRDLMRLRTLGAPAIAGELHASAHVVRSARALTIDADAHAAALVLPTVRIDRLDAHVATVDVSGVIKASAFGVSAATVHLAKLTLDAHGDRKAISLAIDSDGPRATRLALSAHGSPIFVKGRPVGADALVQGILFMTHGRKWNTAGPFAVHAEPDLVRVTGFRLASNPQVIALDGSWQRGGAIAGTLRADHLDAKALEPIIAPGHRLPETDVHLGATVRGTTSTPIADLELGGSSKPDETTGLLQIEGQLTAHVAAGRVHAVLGASIAGQSIEAHADLPLSGRDGHAPLDAAVKFGVLFDPILGGFLLPALTDLMPLALRSLQGRITGDATLSGTVGSPLLSTHSHIGAWGSSPVKGAADLAVSYGNTHLSATLATQLSSLPAGGGNGGGTVDAELSSEIDLGTILELPKRVVGTLLAAQVTAILRAHDVELGVVPWDALGVDLPGAAGRVDGTVSLTGTLAAPVLHANLDGRDMAGPHIDHADASLAFAYQRPSAKYGASINLRGAPLLRLHGSAEIDPAHLNHWREFPFRIDGEVPSYPLAKIPELGGAVDGALSIELSGHGTAGRPEGYLRLNGAAVRIGSAHFSSFAGETNFDGAIASISLDANETSGRLRVQAKLPIGASQPLTVTAHAENFRLDFDSQTLPGLRTARGELNAELTIRGTRLAPKIDGSLRIDRGAIALARSPILYHDLALDLGFHNGNVALRHLDLAASNGTLHLSGDGQLDGANWTRLDGHAALKEFPIRESGIDAWVTATADLHAERKGETLRGKVTVKEGSARLADLTARHSLQSTGTPTDVVFTDATGRRATLAIAKAAQAHHASGSFAISVPGPFHVQSGEVNADLAGDIQVDLVGDATQLGGEIEARNGTLVLFGRRYLLDHGSVHFDGTTTINPALDVQISRPVADATIGVQVNGNALHPDVVFTSMPPVYSQSQIVGMILSGDEGTMQVDDQSLDEQVVGALSGVIVGAVKNQLAPKLPIDVMKVALARDLDGMERTRVEVGKYIGAGIYASYVHQFGGAGTLHLNENQLEVDYRFARSFEIQSMFGDEGAGSLDLFWTHRF